MSSNQKIILYTSVPFGVALVPYCIAIFSAQPVGLKEVAIGLFIGYLLNLLIWPKSFVCSMDYDKTNLRLSLKNSLLQQDIKSYSLSELSKPEFKQKSLFIRDFSELRFTYKGNNLKFKLIGKGAGEQAKALIKHAYQAHSKSNETDFELPFAAPWLDMLDEPQETKNAFLEELKKEVHQDHTLYRLKAMVIGQRQDNDDILIELENGKVAVVHLTWAGKREHGIWPATRMFSDKRAFWEKAMKLDIEEFDS